MCHRVISESIDHVLITEFSSEEEGVVEARALAPGWRAVTRLASELV